MALWDGDSGAGTVLARRALVLARGQAEVLVPMILDVLDEAGCGFPAVDRFGVTMGPGAFTGLRIGLAVARGLALATGRPLVGITTFDAVVQGLAGEAIGGRRILVAIESRRDDLFVQLFGSNRTPLGPPEGLRPDRVAQGLPAGPMLVAGDGAPHLRAALAGRPDVVFADGTGVPDAAVVARLAASREPDAAPPAPFYLRPPDARLPGAPGR